MHSYSIFSNSMIELLVISFLLCCNYSFFLLSMDIYLLLFFTLIACYPPPYFGLLLSYKSYSLAELAVFALFGLSSYCINDLSYLSYFSYCLSLLASFYLYSYPFLPPAVPLPLAKKVLLFLLFAPFLPSLFFSTLLSVG